MSSSGSDSASNDETMEGLWERVSYTWTVNDLSSDIKAATNIFSPVFYNENEDFAWKLSLSKDNPSNSNYLSLYLNLDTMPCDSVEAKYTFTVRCSGKGVIIPASADRRRFTRNERSWGFAQFLQTPSPWYTKRILKIDVEIVFKLYDLDPKAHILVMGLDFPEAKLQKSMNDLLESSKFTDVVFEVEEAKLKAHKLVLSARSPVFAAMFTHESAEEHSGVVKLVDCNSNVFRQFLRFVYSGQADISSFDVAAELYRTAEKYDFPDLKLRCTNFMSTNLNLSNVAAALLFAETFDIKDLKTIAMDYIVENIKIFKDVKMEVYEPIQEKYPKLLTELLILVTKWLL